MGRPPELLDIGNPKNRVLRWVNGSGRHRALYLERRGQTIQARISGFGMQPRGWFPAGVASLPVELLLIQNGWGPGWRVERGVEKSSLPYHHIAAWLRRTSPDAVSEFAAAEVVAAPAGHVVNQLGLAL